MERALRLGAIHLFLYGLRLFMQEMVLLVDKFLETFLAHFLLATNRSILLLLFEINFGLNVLFRLLTKNPQSVLNRQVQEHLPIYPRRALWILGLLQ